ncbi:hypothetical protein RHGRI_037386 [Rhododendron griersonianum]|uniref:Uncharacterized protein n=1 Tax=Rhododendron griersonianum TaxID=479676 RepID=A0AAV6HX73_9ERIC|nr:hypothetical protein RHGRI_037386 [Rhododendron griersonianum]
MPSGGAGNGTQQKRHRPHHFPLCYSGSLGVTSHCSSRLLSLSAFKAIALPSYLLAPAKVVIVKNRGRGIAACDSIPAQSKSPTTNTAITMPFIYQSSMSIDFYS